MPSTLAPGVVRALHHRGIQELYSHQARAFDLASRGLGVRKASLAVGWRTVFRGEQMRHSPYVEEVSGLG